MIGTNDLVGVGSFVLMKECVCVCVCAPHILIYYEAPILIFINPDMPTVLVYIHVHSSTHIISPLRSYKNHAMPIYTRTQHTYISSML